jgi:ethanolamine utilization microcompartment shell protein EutS
MESTHFQFALSELNLNVSQIESVMGYKQGESQETISDLISEVLKETEAICNIKGEYRILSDIQFNDVEKTIEINHLVFQIKKIVYGLIKKSDSIAVFLCTAGEGIGIRSKKAMKEGDLLTGYIYDVIGSEIVESAADLMQNELEKTVISSGKKITNRYSPGYCGWDVTEQHKLFELVPSNFCGIRLTESALMDPIKSVSGIIGIGENVRFNPYTCNLCDNKNCIYGNAREKN